MALLFFRQLKANGMGNFAYLVGDEDSGAAAAVDPPFNPKPIIDLLGETGLKLVYIINTHGHFDHTGGNDRLKKTTGAKIVAYESSRVRKDLAVKDGDLIRVGGVKIKVIHTPGHTHDGISLLVEDRIVITGDTLFVGECGRTDLEESDPMELYDSLFNKLMKLDDKVEVYPGHDYGIMPHSTIGYEKKTNYTLKPRTKEEFAEFMAQP